MGLSILRNKEDASTPIADEPRKLEVIAAGIGKDTRAALEDLYEKVRQLYAKR